MFLLGQLIYTSFSQVGFQALTSAAIPPEIRQAFIHQIVYQYWDSYNPPSTDYRAVYINRVSPNHTLFGWLYNDGVDDFGRSHVPYFVCYYFAGLLEAAHLEAIFSCLSIGPVSAIDRHHLPDRLENIVIEDDQNYHPARPGVVISSQFQDQSRAALQQEKLFKLFVPESKNQPSFGGAIVEELASPHLLSTLVGGNAGIDSATMDPTQSVTLTQSLEPSEIEAYKQILVTKIRTASSQRQAELTFIWRLGIAVVAVSLIALAAGSFYLFRRFPVATVQPTPAASSQKSLRLENLTLAKTLTDHSDSVWSVILSPDGKTLFSGSADRTIKIWNVETGTVLNTLVGHQDVVRSLALTPDRKTLISGSGGSFGVAQGANRTIKVWDLQTNQLIQTLEEERPVWSVAVSPDGQTLISGNEDGTLKVWNLPTGNLLKTIPAHQNRIFSVVISPDGKTVATASLDKTLKIWNLQTGELLRTIIGHSDAVRALAFSPDGQTLASASWDKTLKLWNWQTGELIRMFTGHSARVVTVAFSVDGQTLISGSVDNTINLWSIQNGKLLRTLSDHTDWILSVATSDSNHFVSSSKDRTIRIWQFR